MSRPRRPFIPSIHAKKTKDVHQQASFQNHDAIPQKTITETSDIAPTQLPSLSLDSVSPATTLEKTPQTNGVTANHDSPLPEKPIGETNSQDNCVNEDELMESSEDTPPIVDEEELEIPEPGAQPEEPEFISDESESQDLLVSEAEDENEASGDDFEDPSSAQDDENKSEIEKEKEPQDAENTSERETEKETQEASPEKPITPKIVVGVAQKRSRKQRQPQKKPPREKKLPPTIKKTVQPTPKKAIDPVSYAFSTLSRGGRTIPAPKKKRVITSRKKQESPNAESGEKKERKKSRFKLKTLLLRAMIKEQKSAHMRSAIPSKPLKRLIREILHETSQQSTNTVFRVERNAFSAIQVACEDFLINEFKRAELAMSATKVETLFPRHMQLSRRLRDMK